MVERRSDCGSRPGSLHAPSTTRPDGGRRNDGFTGFETGAVELPDAVRRDGRRFMCCPSPAKHSTLPPLHHSHRRRPSHRRAMATFRHIFSGRRAHGLVQRSSRASASAAKAHVELARLVRLKRRAGDVLAYGEWPGTSNHRGNQLPARTTPRSAFGCPTSQTASPLTCRERHLQTPTPPSIVKSRFDARMASTKSQPCRGARLRAGLDGASRRSPPNARAPGDAAERAIPCLGRCRRLGLVRAFLEARG
jgi:hypothetical protein